MTDRRGGQRKHPGAGSRRKRAVLPGLCGLALALVTACSSSGGVGDAAAGASSAASTPSSSAATAPTASESAAPSGSPSAAPSSAEAVIQIQDFAYETPASVAPGATVSVMNADGEAHTVTADEGDAFDAQVTGDGTGTFTAPLTPGTYAFHCTYHANMHGELVVE